MTATDPAAALTLAPRILHGKAWLFGDYINTDIIIPFRFKSRTNDPEEMAKYAMYGIDPEFPKKISKGDFVVAGKNFGGGSSREQAPVALKYAGVAAVVAESFARIFYRNCFAIGFPIITIPDVIKKVKQGDELDVDLDNLTLRVLRTGEVLQCQKITGYLRELFFEGGLVEYYKRHKEFPWQTEEELQTRHSHKVTDSSKSP